MAEFVIVEGMVIGGHALRDLGKVIPYREEVPIDSNRANWSRDLNHAIQRGLVRKVRVTSGGEPRLLRSSPTPPTPPPAKVAPQPKPKTRPSSPAPQPPQAVSSENSALLKASLEENARLREMNESLMETSETLMEKQQLLMDKLMEFIDKPPVIVTHGNATTAAVTHADDLLVRDEPVMYIPQQIRAEGVNASSEVQVSSSTSDGSKASKAAEILRKMREDNEKTDG